MVARFSSAIWLTNDSLPGLEPYDRSSHVFQVYRVWLSALNMSNSFNRVESGHQVWGNHRAVGG